MIVNTISSDILNHLEIFLSYKWLLKLQTKNEVIYCYAEFIWLSIAIQTSRKKITSDISHYAFLHSLTEKNKILIFCNSH